jgi:hypothetical protein
MRVLLFRTTNHKLPIETGRWNGIDRENRQCLKCNSRSIGDEFHYIMECHFFTENRTTWQINNRYTNTYTCTYNIYITTGGVKY